MDRTRRARTHSKGWRIRVRPRSAAHRTHDVRFFACFWGHRDRQADLRPRRGTVGTFHAPCFVVSKDAQPTITKEGGTSYTFVTDGIESAVAQAKAAASGKDVMVMGGASTAQQCLRAGLLDEIQIHLAPVLLGDGTRLFDHLGTERIELERTRVIEAPDVTHLHFRVVR